jgi:hypothetical protein
MRSSVVLRISIEVDYSHDWIGITTKDVPFGHFQPSFCRWARRYLGYATCKTVGCQSRSTNEWAERGSRLSGYMFADPIPILTFLPSFALMDLQDLPRMPLLYLLDQQ